MTGSAIGYLDLFHKLCGDESLKNVVLVTSWWESTGEVEGRRREEELEHRYWEPLLALGARSRRHYNTVESAQELVLSMVEHSPVPVKLQTELAKGKKLADTPAGALVNASLHKVIKKQKAELAELKRSMQSAIDRGM